MTTPHPMYPPTLGARPMEDSRCRFLVWAPKADRVELNIVHPEQRLIPMQPRDRGYFELIADDVSPGTEYFYRLSGSGRGESGCVDRPDPASRCQPHGVHHASAVVDWHFDWQDDDWRGIPLKDYICYEVHVGTFTPEGTFDAVINHLDDLKDLGITALELMPVAQFPGGRNWGYDGVHPFAVQNTYGGPQGLKRLVNACHQRGLAVVMDVVYNHIGPEGNYLGEFGHYFTDRHRTPWGEAINFDAPHSDEVRRFFIENALYWIDEFHIDALRLDAVHAIYDFSARPFLQELAHAVHLEGERLNRRVFTIAESSLNDARLITPREQNGLGIDAQWCDDLHHSLRALLTGDSTGYYADFRGFDDLLKTYRDGWALDGRYSTFRGRRHGNSARHIPPERIVVCAQNHDQVGNRLLGERLSEHVSFEALKLAAAAVILSPYQPLLFMGEEYGETSRFQYFVSHTDPALVEAVRTGRREEFAAFQWDDDPPDPQDPATFERSRLNHELKSEPRHAGLREFYKELIELRKTDPAFGFAERDRMETHVLLPGTALALHRRSEQHEVLVVLHFGQQSTTIEARLPAGRWSKRLDSALERWHGPGSSLPEHVESSGSARLSFTPASAAVFQKPMDNARPSG